MKRTRLKRKTRLKKRGKSPITKLKQELKPLFRAYIRQRDKNTCQKCGKKVYGRNSHVSHVLPKDKYRSLEWDEENVKILCFYCHQQWHLNPLESITWFISRFPQRRLSLQHKKHHPLQLNEPILQAQIDYYKD